MSQAMLPPDTTYWQFYSGRMKALIFEGAFFQNRIGGKPQSRYAGYHAGFGHTLRMGSADGLDRVNAYGDLSAFSDADLNDIAVAAAALCQTPIALVSILDQDRLWFSARVGTDQPFGPLANSGCGQVIARKVPVVIPDMLADPYTQKNTLVCGVPGLRFYAGYPLFDTQGRVVGTLCVVDLETRSDGLSSHQKDGLAALARQSMRLMDLRQASVTQERRFTAQQLRSQRAAKRVREAEAERRHALEKYALQQAAGAAGGIGIYEYDLVSGDITVSPEVCRIAGIDLIPTLSAEQWIALIHPDDKVTIPTLNRILEGTAPLRLQYRILRASDGKERWVLRQGILDHDEAGRPIRLIGTLQDVTPERNATARLTTLLAIGDALRTAETRQKALQETCQLLGNRLDAQRVGFARISMREERFTVEQSWCAAEMPPINGEFSFEAFRHTSDFLRGGSVFILDDITHTSWMSVEQAAYQSVNVIAQVLVPKIRGGDLTGCLFVHSSQPREWTVDETSFIRTAADRIFAGLDEWDTLSRQDLINHEILHRLKNTLSIVQSLAHQGFRGVEDQSALTTFTARLIALGSAHDQLMRRNWQSTDLASLTVAVMTPLGLEGRVKVNGPFLCLGPDTATSFSMVLHELATNALKHGALSVSDGIVSLNWTVEGYGPESAMMLTWQETDGPSVTVPNRTGFGIRLLQAGLGHQGKTELHYDPEGLRVEMTASIISMASH